MSVSALGRASHPQLARSSVPQCHVHHFTVITVLLVSSALCTMASSQPKNLCQQNPVTFADKILTIGWIDDELWAITKSDWNVYKLTPCNPANYSLVHCMEVDSPVAVNTKWQKLVESVKSAAQSTDLTFSVDNSAVMHSSEFGHTILAMHSKTFKNTSYFGFDFGTSKSVYTNEFADTHMFNGLWISSNENVSFRFLNSGQQVEQYWFHRDVAIDKISLMIMPLDHQKNICKIGSKDDLQVQFKEGDCSPDGASMIWSVSKGVLYNKQFYLFSSDLVYIFSDQAETGWTRMQTVALADFFHCYEPSTLPHSTSPNATNHQFTANSTDMSTTAKGYTTIIIIVGVVVLFVAILALITTYYCWCHTKASNGNTNKGTSSPKDSKVNAKAGTVSKGSLKRSQTNVKTVAPKLSSGKQSQH